MKKTFALIFILIFSLPIYAQVMCNASAPNGSGYLSFAIAGFSLEKPDCQHPDFGPHITQIYDSTLQRNVFVFHSHSTDDSDRCINFDRVRMEVKGGPNTTTALQHVQGSKSFYRWKFKLNENFIASSNFCHLFQNKAYSGTDSSFPILTITARQNQIEIMQNGGNNGTTLGVVATANLDLFLGKWMEVYVEQKHQEQGELLIEIKDMITGATILQYQNNDIDLWRNDAQFNRPKWGIYRKKNSMIKDEKILFADFCISEVDSLECPSEAGMLVSNSDNPTQQLIVLYPNPTKEQICINSKRLKNATAIIFSADGKQMTESLNLHNQACVNISKYKKGFYFVQFKLTSGRQFQKSFLVQ